MSDQKRPNLPTHFRRTATVAPADATEGERAFADANGGWYAFTAEFDGQSVPIGMARDMMDIRDREDALRHRRVYEELLERHAVAHERQAAAWERLAAVVEKAGALEDAR